MKHNGIRLLAVLLLLAWLPGALTARASETEPTQLQTEPAEETEPIAETTEPETTEPSTEATEPETTEPSTEATEPETTEPSTEATEPETTEPSTQATEPDSTDPTAEETQPAEEKTLPEEMPVLLTLLSSEPVEITLFPGEEYELSELGTITAFEVQNSDDEILTDSGLTLTADGMLRVSEDTAVGVYGLEITHTDSEGNSTVSCYQITVELICYYVEIPANINAGEQYRITLDQFSAPEGSCICVTADPGGYLRGNGRTLTFTNSLSGSCLDAEGESLTGLVTVTKGTAISGTYTGQLNFQFSYIPAQ